LHNTGGSLAVREPNEFYFLALAGATDVFRVYRAPERRFYANHFRRAAFRNDGHAFGKHSVDADDALVASFHRIQHRRFDAA
jgi:hypothetical protein